MCAKGGHDPWTWGRFSSLKGSNRIAQGNALGKVSKREKP
jgi:hypothetical protein